MNSVQIFLFIVIQLFIGCCFGSEVTDNETVYDNWRNFTGRYTESYYSITCCRNGFPVPDPSLVKYIKEWTQQLLGPLQYSDNTTCNRYRGRYSLPYGLTQNNKDVQVGVQCQCPEEKLDRNCRYLPDCFNSGYRSFSINLRCVCAGQYFGELCEKYCLNGNLVKNDRFIDQCLCQPFFYGEECQNVVCLNNGTAVNSRGCLCPMPYVGPHCESRLNDGTLDNFHNTRSDVLHSNLSGTAISLFLILCLTLLCIFLLKRRRLRNALSRTRNNFVVGFIAQPEPAVLQTTGSTDNANRANTSDNVSVSSLPPLPKYSDCVKSEPPPYWTLNLNSGTRTDNNDNINRASNSDNRNDNVTNV